MNSVHCLSLILELFLISVCNRVDPLCITPSHVYARLAGSSQSLINWWQANIRDGQQPLQCPRHRSQTEAGRREDGEQLTPEMLSQFFFSVCLGGPQASCHLLYIDNQEHIFRNRDTGKQTRLISPSQVH